MKRLRLFSAPESIVCSWKIISLAAHKPSPMTTTIPFDGTTAVSLKASDHSRFDQWNRTEVEFDCGKLVHDLFDEQALRTPEKIAIICRDRVLTYGGLREKVHRLARRLRRLGVGPETVVAIFMERSIDMVVAMLGVLEGGRSLPSSRSRVPA